MDQAVRQLDPRLETVLAFFPHCDTAADIGTDHGLIPLHLLIRGICRHVIATDISTNALRKAEMLFSRYHLEDHAEFLCGDGMEPLKDKKVDAVSICGMGGKTVSRILLNGSGFLKNAELIISAQTQLPLVRRALHLSGYRIEREKIIQSRDLFYFLIHAVHGNEAADDIQIEWGKAILDHPDATAARYIAWQAGLIAGIADEHMDERKRFLLQLASQIPERNTFQEE